MNRMISKMTLALVTAGCACLAQAGVRTVDVPRITNGGTGYIGLTESAGTPRPAMHEAWRGTATMGSSAASQLPASRCGDRLAGSSRRTWTSPRATSGRYSGSEFR